MGRPTRPCGAGQRGRSGPAGSGEMRVLCFPVRGSIADRSSQMEAAIRNPMSTNPMLRFAKSLFGQVLIELLLGLPVGPFAAGRAVQRKPLGDGFIRLIKMIIPVLVFCVVVHGIAGAGDLRRVGRVGVKALIYF